MNHPDLDDLQSSWQQDYRRHVGQIDSVSANNAQDVLDVIDYARELEQRVRHLEMNLVVHVEMEHDAHAERIAELEAALEPFANAFHLNGIESIRWSPTLLHFKDAAQVLNK